LLHGNATSGSVPQQEDVVLEETEVEIPIGLVQQVTRVREEGRESIHALVQAEIAAGDRMAVVHLAFCPPLEATPELTAHAVEAEDAEVKLTQAETFGARIEVRLGAAVKEPCGVIVEVIGAAATQRDAK